jgi:outer membrane protein assembly factor BamB
VATGSPYRDTARPYIGPAAAESLEGVSVDSVPVGPTQRTLGDVGVGARVAGPERFSATLVVIPFQRDGTVGLDTSTIRMFRQGAEGLVPLWNSGVNPDLGYAWACITRPGEYFPIGLPRDVLLREALRTLAEQRRYLSGDSLEEMREVTRAVLRPLLQARAEEIERWRRTLAEAEIQTGGRPLHAYPIRTRPGGYLDAFALPKSLDLAGLQERLATLAEEGVALPEEALFFPPEVSARDEPWPSTGAPLFAPGFAPPGTWPWEHESWPLHLPRPLPWFRHQHSQNWPMYQHDSDHSGHASGHSGIRSTTVGALTTLHDVALAGTALTKPAIANGKVYIGTFNGPGSTGVLHKVDIASGLVEHTFSTLSRSGYARGIGGTPAIAHGRVYVSNVPGTLHCLHAHDLSPIWSFDFRSPSQAQNHPVINPLADCWTGPVVVGDRVYVGCGEGEYGAFGFVYCLDADDGHVIWLFSTNWTGPGDNAHNAIPKSAAISPLPGWAVASGFSVVADPAMRGCSVWSSPACDRHLHRIFVGTGNSVHGIAIGQPDDLYGSGVLSLDAHSGAFKGFYEPPAADSYRANDDDVDVCGSPTLFSHEGHRYVAIGSKSGAFWIFDAHTMALVAHRNVLPFIDDDPTKPLPSIDMHVKPAENNWGIYGTPAFHPGTGRLFVGVGGDDPGTIDYSSTPFVRAIHLVREKGVLELRDAWHRHHDPDGVWRYTNGRPPLYTNPGERGLTSPAVVNDVVFVGTTLPGLYAFDVHHGHCVWSDTTLSGGDFVMGCAISGRHVAVTAGSFFAASSLLRIYSL